MSTNLIAASVAKWIKCLPNVFVIGKDAKNVKYKTPQNIWFYGNKEFHINCLVTLLVISA